MKRLEATADTNGDGLLNKQEFRKMFEDLGLQKWFASMEFIPKDVDFLFDMMHDGDGSLTVDELIKGVARFKGTARNIDVQMLMHENRQLVSELKSFHATVGTYLP